MINSIQEYENFFNSEIVRFDKYPTKGTLDPRIVNDNGIYSLRGFINGVMNYEQWKKEKMRICFLLKEPVMKKEEYEATDDHACHNQRKEFSNYVINDFLDEDNKTYVGIIYISYFLWYLLQDFPIPENFNENKAIEIFRNNVCILNTNWFPSYGGKSDDKLIWHWAQRNMENLYDQYKFFNPTLLIGAHTLTHLNNPKDNNHGNLFNQIPVKILTSPLLSKILSKESPWGNTNHTYFSSTKEIFINTYHPSLINYDKGKALEYAKDIKTIYNWIKDRKGEIQ